MGSFLSRPTAQTPLPKSSTTTVKPIPPPNLAAIIKSNKQRYPPCGQYIPTILLILRDTASKEIEIEQIKHLLCRIDPKLASGSNSQRWNVARSVCRRLELDHGFRWIKDLPQSSLSVDGLPAGPKPNVGMKRTAADEIMQPASKRSHYGSSTVFIKREAE